MKSPTDKSPISSPFSWPIRVYYEDTDAQGVVYYANYFRFMERARTEWLRSLGVEQDVLMRDARRYFVVVDTQCRFLKPARFNDELVATARLGGLDRASFSIEQNIYRDSLQGELLTAGHTKAAYVNADTGRPVRVPAELFKETINDN